MARGRYEVSMNSISTTAAVTLVGLLAPSTAILEIVRFSISTAAIVSEASTLQIIRTSTAGTNTAATPSPLGAYAASGATGGSNYTAEPTTTLVIHDAKFNLVAGYTWVALDEEGRIVVPPSGRLTLKLNTVPTGATVISAQIEFIEKG